MRDLATVLIIERDTDLAMGAARWLSGEGFQTLTSQGGMHGIRLALNHRPQVILLDTGVAPVKGRPFLTFLKENSNTATTSLILFSTDANTAETAATTSIRFLVTKPFHPATLIRTVREGLDHFALKNTHRVAVPHYQRRPGVNPVRHVARGFLSRDCRRNTITTTNVMIGAETRHVQASSFGRRRT